jgi:hypothetical protein
MATQTTGVGPDTRITFEVAGSIPVYLTTGVFKERLILQLTTQGFKVERVDVQTGYGLSARDYKATVVLVTLAAVLNINTLTGRVATAAEDSGSYTPTVTVPSIGQSTQADPSRNVVDDVTDALGAIVRGAGAAVEGAGTSIKWLPLLVVGVLLVVAFSPNVRSIARAAR